MGTKRITDLATVAAVLDDQYFPLDDGIQSYKAPASLISTYMQSKAPVVTPLVTKTTTYSMLNTDRVILADTSGGAWTLTIPAASSSNAGIIYRIQKISADFTALTLGTGLSTKLHTIGEYIEIANDATTWRVLNRGGISGKLISTTNMTIISSGASAPTKGTGVIEKTAWYRVGSMIRCFWNYKQTGAGSDGSANAYFIDAVPHGSGLTIDTTNLSPGFSDADEELAQCGMGAADNNTTWAVYHAIYGDNTSGKTGVQFMRDGANCWGQEIKMGNATVRVSAQFELPITDWNA